MTHRQSARRFVFVTSSLGAGGAQAMLVKVLERIDRERYEPIVISLRDLGVYGPQIIALGVPLHCLGVTGAVTLPGGLWKLRGLLRCLEPDLIQGWMYHGNVAASIGRYMASLDAPVAWNIRHSLHDLACEGASLRLLIKLSAGWSRRIALCLYPSDTARAQHEALGFSRSQSRVIPNGFAIDRYHPATQAEKSAARAARGISPGAVVIVHLARFHPMKNHGGFIDAIADAIGHAPGIRVLMAGDGVSAANQDLSRRIDRLGLNEKMTLLGELADVRSVLVCADLLCLSSSWGEAFPNVLGEAMSMGVPCIATDVGDCRAIVADSGMVIPPNDRNSLKDAILSLVKLDARSRDALGSKARARVVNEYEIGSIVKRYEACYAAIVEAVRG